MSDPESELRSEASSLPRTGRHRRSTGLLEHREIDDATSHVPRSIPTNAGLSSKNDKVDVSEDFFAITFGSLQDAVPTRSDYTKAPPTIYKVPKELKRGDEDEGYEPVAARIGPFTGNNKSTVQLENYKWCCVRQLISRQHPDGDVTAGLLDMCLESMKRLEPEIRASYSEDIEPRSDDLALKMLLDGCFILHRLLKHARLAEREAQGGDGSDQLEKDDDWTQVFGRIWVWQLVTSDLLLVGNQIPFFVLSKLFEQLGTNEPKDALVKGSLRLFRSLCPQMLQRSASEIDCRRVHHLLHLFYISVAYPTPPTDSKDSCGATKLMFSCWSPGSGLWIPCAKELEEAGVRFRKRKNATSFLDIEFDIHSGVLEIPPLQLYDSSDKLFRNLIAFEQTYPDTRRDISTYAVFMDCLINTPEDMRILHLRGILVNQINGEQDASRFFSRICAQVHWSENNYLKNLVNKVNNYKDSRLHKWRAALVRNYFSNPWVAMSVLAAVLLLGMTILQTTFTVYPYFKPPK